METGGIPGFTEVTDPIAQEQDTASLPTSSAAQYYWEYITDDLLVNANVHVPRLTARIHAGTADVIDVYYELLLTVADFMERSSPTVLIKVLSDILTTFSPIEKYVATSEEFLILASSFNVTDSLKHFLRDCTIDKRLKILHLDKALLRSEGIFPDYNKYQYNDARNRIFSVDTFSSLHEASEGYGKYISTLTSYFDLQDTDTEGVEVLTGLLESIIAEFCLDNKRCFLIMLGLLSHFLDKSETTVLQVLRKSIWWRPSNLNSSVESTVVAYLMNYTGEECKELKLITLLIKEGVLNFHTIYNALQPYAVEIKDATAIAPADDDQLKLFFEAKQLKMQEDAHLATSSALALAAPLMPDSDDEDGSGNTTAKEVETVKEVSILEKAKYYWKLKFLEYLIDFRMESEMMFLLVQHPQILLLSSPLLHKFNILFDERVSPCYFVNVDNLNVSRKATPDLYDNTEPTDIDSLLKTFQKYIPFTGYNIYENPRLLMKIIRTVKHSLENNIKSKDFWLQLYRTYIFPCLPFTNNIFLVNEAFEVLSKFPLQTRYNLYGEFILDSKRDVGRKLNYERTEKKTRDLLKRLSMENVAPSCRALNKIVSTNPIAASGTFISHIESYSSLIELVCESSKYFNDFAWDVITFQLLNKLNSNRSVIQNDGLNYSQWYMNLSQFIGVLGKSYPESFQLTPILLNIVKNLYNENYDIVLVLKEILDSMTGIRSMNNLTTKQILRMNAEQSLRQLAYMSIQDKRETCFRSCKKLLSTLINDNLFGDLFTLLCHIPINLIEKADDKPLKFVNQKCDEVVSLIHNLIIAMDFNMDSAVFKTNMISIKDLVGKYKIHPQWAFEVWRRHLAKDIKKDGNTSTNVLYSMGEDIKTSLGDTIDFETLNMNFYLSFWQLSLYDIDYKDISYMMEYSDLRSQVMGIKLKLKHKKELPPKELKTLEEQEKKLSDILMYVKMDMETHEANYKDVVDRLEKEKLTWGEESAVTDDTKDESAMMFIEYCALPRLQHSPFDAVYVNKMIFFLHELDTVSFSLKHTLQNLFGLDLLPITLFTNTTNETENLALFYQLVLEKLNEWWKDADLFIKEGKKFGGLDHAGFKKCLFEWHLSLLNQILKSLDSTNYTTKNNCILLVKVLLSNYPVIREHADMLAEKMETISTTDNRDDIKLASRALIGLIKFRKDKYIPIWDFYDMEAEEKDKYVKVWEEKERLEKERLEKIEKDRLEEERKEREKIRLENAAKAVQPGGANLNVPTGPGGRPYGLVGLMAKKSDSSKTKKDDDVKEKDNDGDVKMEDASIKETVEVSPKKKSDTIEKEVVAEAKAKAKAKVVEKMPLLAEVSKESTSAPVKEASISAAPSSGPSRASTPAPTPTPAPASVSKPESKLASTSAPTPTVASAPASAPALAPAPASAPAPSPAAPSSTISVLAVAPVPSGPVVHESRRANIIPRGPTGKTPSGPSSSSSQRPEPAATSATTSTSTNANVGNTNNKMRRDEYSGRNGSEEDPRVSRTQPHNYGGGSNGRWDEDKYYQRMPMEPISIPKGKNKNNANAQPAPMYNDYGYEGYESYDGYSGYPGYDGYEGYDDGYGHVQPHHQQIDERDNRLRNGKNGKGSKKSKSNKKPLPPPPMPPPPGPPPSTDALPPLPPPSTAPPPQDRKRKGGSISSSNSHHKRVRQ